MSAKNEKRQVRLAAGFPGVNSHTVWRDPDAGSQIDFASFKYFARTAEQGFFDFIFLAEGLRLREQAGRILELDVAGRPATLSVLSVIVQAGDSSEGRDFAAANAEVIFSAHWQFDDARQFYRDVKRRLV